MTHETSTVSSIEGVVTKLDKGVNNMTSSVRVIPIECKFGPISAFAYYVDAPEPAIIDTGVSISAITRNRANS